MERQRLDKLIADTGRYSRKQAKELIRTGRVRVNGLPAKSGEQKITFEDEVIVNGAVIRNQNHLYVMMNKPAGVLCATRDPKQPTVLDLLPPGLFRKGLFPAGRLDKDTEGFVLITDDGEFAHHILSPARLIPKTYYAELASGPIDEDTVLQGFASGLAISGGDVCLPAELAVLENSAAPKVRVVIREGMYHQIKRMFAVFSLSVTYLKRIRIGGLMLDSELLPGQSKEILHKDLKRICDSFVLPGMHDFLV